MSHTSQDFDSLLSNVEALLHEQQRLSYRGLKRRFNIDDSLLEDLKAELIDARQIANDENGSVLVYRGNEQSASQNLPTERRHLTVMFCDLVGSTALSEQLDPEDLQEIIRTYQMSAGSMIEKFSGNIAQYLGDGILAYFGYPIAHENDAFRAISAALEMLDSLPQLNTLIQKKFGIDIQIRVGIHSGLTVVGQMGGAGRQEQLAIGETPNVAARLQGLAEPNQLIISQATNRLVDGFFNTNDMGMVDVKGLSQSVHSYRVVSHSGHQSRIDAAKQIGLTPLVDREQERDILGNVWQTANKESNTQFVLLNGDAGTGKSRLIEHFKTMAAEQQARFVEARCLEHFQNTTLHPITDLLQREFGLNADESAEVNRFRLELAITDANLELEATLPLLTPLFSVPLPDAPQILTPQKQREATLKCLSKLFQRWSKKNPLVLAIDDLHWADPTTLDLINQLITDKPQKRLLGLFTCRPQYQHNFYGVPDFHEVNLGALPESYRSAMIESAAGEIKLPSNVIDTLVKKTEGNPLYAEELTRSLLDSNQSLEEDNQDLAIPSTLQASLMSRLDQVSHAKPMAQMGAVIGRAFSYQVLNSLFDSEDSTQNALADLVSAGILMRSSTPTGATYSYRHALLRDAAYELIPLRQRKAMHKQVAETMQQQFAATINPEIVGFHFAAAEEWWSAIASYKAAGMLSISRYANAEAINHFETALALLDQLPMSPEKIGAELELRLYLGAPLMATMGYGFEQVRTNYQRASEICEAIGTNPQLATVYIALASYYVVRMEFPQSIALGQRLADIANDSDNDAMRMRAVFTRGVVNFWAGDFNVAESELTQAITTYNPAQHADIGVEVGHDVGVMAYAHLALTQWHLGKPDQAKQTAKAGIDLARKLGMPHNIAIALTFAAITARYLEDREWLEQLITELLPYADQHGFPLWLADAMVLKGWLLAESGQLQQGIDLTRQGIEIFKMTGALLFSNEQNLNLCELLIRNDQIEEAEAVWQTAAELTALNESDYLQADLGRVAALINAAKGNEETARSQFCEAMELAKERGQNLVLLKCAVQGCEALCPDEITEHGRELLSKILPSIEDTPDCRTTAKAKALLEKGCVSA